MGAASPTAGPTETVAGLERLDAMIYRARALSSLKVRRGWIRLTGW